MLGIEGSANKIGVGIVSDEGVILSNPRHTYDPLYISKYKVNLHSLLGSKMLLRNVCSSQIAYGSKLLRANIHYASRAGLSTERDSFAPPGKTLFENSAHTSDVFALPHCMCSISAYVQVSGKTSSILTSAGACSATGERGAGHCWCQVIRHIMHSLHQGTTALCHTDCLASPSALQA